MIVKSSSKVSSSSNIINQSYLLSLLFIPLISSNPSGVKWAFEETNERTFFQAK